VVVVDVGAIEVEVVVALFDRADRLINDAVMVAPPMMSAAMIGPNLVRLHHPTERFGLTTCTVFNSGVTGTGFGSGGLVSPGSLMGPSGFTSTAFHSIVGELRFTNTSSIDSTKLRATGRSTHCLVPATRSKCS
jgi:hypothetical protein